jgi:hypothetical protein
MSYALQNACQKENERISTMPFLLWHFSPGDKIENCSAQFLAVRWIVHVEFKLHRLRHGFSVSNALLLGLEQSASEPGQSSDFPPRVGVFFCEDLSAFDKILVRKNHKRALWRRRQIDCDRIFTFL